MYKKNSLSYIDDKTRNVSEFKGPFFPDIIFRFLKPFLHVYNISVTFCANVQVRPSKTSEDVDYKSLLLLMLTDGWIARVKHNAA